MENTVQFVAVFTARNLKDFFDEQERHLAENVHAFCVIL